ncbi:MAG: hypothetical protein OXC37_02310, partial [Bdellovibrionaceae bacterium]|nr:hypothetical protein [Pseudobdellovibrionaceae bacterium]
FGFEHIATTGRFVAKRMSEFLDLYLISFSHKAKNEFGFEHSATTDRFVAKRMSEFLALYLTSFSHKD